ncbi:MAG: NAD(P)H-dependent oxidoreductase [Saprospiraceae bacterium]
MIAIVSGTNRPNSKTEFISQYLFDLIGKYTDEEVNLIKLTEIPPDLISPGMYATDGQSEALAKLQDEVLIPSDKWILISPEYNGSYSGIVKVFLDALSVRNYAQTFNSKKTGLVGVASGRAGNLRGLDHLTTSLNYLGMNIFPNRLPIAQIDSKITDDKLNDETIDVLNKFLENFVKF